jgi:hypothetical protein
MRLKDRREAIVQPGPGIAKHPGGGHMMMKLTTKAVDNRLGNSEAMSAPKNSY